MDDAGRVLQECAADPDNDAPRLVWADSVGGDRGELVVVQCDLARGDLSPAQAAKRRARERELLEAHGVAWAGDLARVAGRWAYHRGFIEAVKLRSLACDPVVLPPLVSTIAIAPTAEVSSEALGELAGRRRLRGLGLHAPRFATTELGAAPALANLRALAVERPTLETLVPLLRTKPITQLRVTQHRFATADVQKLVAAAPGIMSLDVSPERGHDDDAFLGVFLHRPLRALRITNLGWKHLMYMAEHSATTLAHLAFPLAHEGPRTIAELAKYTALRTLELSGDPHQIHAAVEALARTAGAFAALRVLRIAERLFPDELTTLRARFANQLEILEAPAVHAPRLLHDDLAASFTLAPACYQTAPAVCIAQPGAKVWEVPERAADEPITIGRDAANDIVVVSAFVARRHAALIWEDGAHTLVDLRSDNGTWIDGAMVYDGRRVTDGTRFLCGNVPLVYCAGNGAPARAQRIVQAVGGT